MRDNKTGATSQIHKKPDSFGRFPKYKIGETVYKNPQGQVAAATFSVHGTREDRVGTGHMNTSVILSETGRLDGQTRTWTSDTLSGFEGGVLVVIADIRGKILWTSTLHKYGVNGTAQGHSDRTETWSETVPDAVMNNAAVLAIAQQNVGKNFNLTDFLNQTAQVLGPALQQAAYVLEQAADLTLKLVAGAALAAVFFVVFLAGASAGSA